MREGECETLSVYAVLCYSFVSDQRAPSLRSRTSDRNARHCLGLRAQVQAIPETVAPASQLVLSTFYGSAASIDSLIVKLAP